MLDKKQARGTCLDGVVQLPADFLPLHHLLFRFRQLLLQIGAPDLQRVGITSPLLSHTLSQLYTEVKRLVSFFGTFLPSTSALEHLRKQCLLAEGRL
jgi:hypothetical protein